MLCTFKFIRSGSSANRSLWWPRRGAFADRQLWALTTEFPDGLWRNIGRDADVGRLRFGNRSSAASRASLAFRSAVPSP
jgi:hypothetical protein